MCHACDRIEALENWDPVHPRRQRSSTDDGKGGVASAGGMPLLGTSPGRFFRHLRAAESFWIDPRDLNGGDADKGIKACGKTDRPVTGVRLPLPS